MLALIGLKKFRSFQKPNRIDVLEKKTRRLGAGPRVDGIVAESRESGGRLQNRFGGPEAKKGRWKTLDLSATLINSYPSDLFSSIHRELRRLERHVSATDGDLFEFLTRIASL